MWILKGDCDERTVIARGAAGLSDRHRDSTRNSPLGPLAPKKGCFEL